MYPARTSGTDSSIAALNPNGDCDYFVEHIILLVSCVYAASQDSKAFYIASVFVVLIGSYNWMLSILRPPPSVAAWIALSDTASSTASFSLDGAFDYLVEHMMLLVSCVYAASQGSGAFFFTSLFTVLISTYIWIQAVLQFSPSVPPRRMTSGFLNCEEPFRIRRGLEPDALRSSSDTGLEVSYHGIGSAQQQDYGIETHRLDVVDGIALEADVCDNVPRPPLLEIDPDIFTADIQCADVCVNTCDTVPHLPLLEIDPDIFTEEVRYVDTGVCDTVPHLPLLEIDPDIFTAALDMKDVRFVMSQAGVSMELAVAALKENDNDLVDSIMWAAGEFEGSHRAQTPVNDGQRGRFEHCFVFLPSRQEQSPQVMTDEATASEESHVTDTKTKSRSKERRAKRQRERRAKERLKKRVFGAANLRQSATFAEQMSLYGWTLVDPVRFASQLRGLLPSLMAEGALQELVNEGYTTHGHSILELASSWRLDVTERGLLGGESRKSDERNRLLVKNTWVERYWKVSE